MADPIGLLFAGKGLVLECSECGTKYRADVRYGAVGLSTTLQGKLEPEEHQED